MKHYFVWPQKNNERRKEKGSAAVRKYVKNKENGWEMGGWLARRRNRSARVGKLQ